MAFNIEDAQDYAVHRTRFKIEQYAMSMKLSPDIYRVNSIIDLATEYMIIRVDRAIATQHMEGYVIQWPKNTWEFFKQDYMPKWFTKKFPVKYSVHTVDFKIKYPEFKLDRNHIGRGYVEVLEQINEHYYL